MARSQRRVSQPRRSIIRLWWFAVLLAPVIFGGWLGWPVSPRIPSSSTPPAVASAARRETRPTLDPALFVGKARVAHAVARDIPDVLDQLYCYCGCDKSAGHKSLLSCYTDNHAAT